MLDDDDFPPLQTSVTDPPHWVQPRDCALRVDRFTARRREMLRKLIGDELYGRLHRPASGPHAHCAAVLARA